jgi:hypothetical protein
VLAVLAEQVFFSANGYGLSQETAERKVKVQSACALNTLHYYLYASNYVYATQWL